MAKKKDNKKVVRASTKANRANSKNVKSTTAKKDKKAQKTKTKASRALSTLKNQVSKKPASVENPVMQNTSLDTSNPFGLITDEKRIQDTMDAATKSAYDVKAQEAAQGLNAAEDQSYANTQNAVKGLKDSMLSSTASGANRGAAGANAVQALLGLGQQNNALTTQGLQTIQNVAGERAAAMAQNAADAIDKSNAAKTTQGDLSTQKYAADSSSNTARYQADSDRFLGRYEADQNYRSAAATAMGGLAGSMHSDATNYDMNNATNAANQAVAATTGKFDVKSARVTGRDNRRAARITGKYNVRSAKAGK